MRHWPPPHGILTSVPPESSQKHLFHQEKPPHPSSSSEGKKCNGLINPPWLQQPGSPLHPLAVYLGAHELLAETMGAFEHKVVRFQSQGWETLSCAGEFQTSTRVEFDLVWELPVSSGHSQWGTQVDAAAFLRCCFWGSIWWSCVPSFPASSSSSSSCHLAAGAAESSPTYPPQSWSRGCIPQLHQPSLSAVLQTSGALRREKERERGADILNVSRTCQRSYLLAECASTGSRAGAFSRLLLLFRGD